jgi:ribonuclease E
MPVTKAEPVKRETADFEDIAEVISNAPEVVASPVAAGEREHPKRNNARRGPNRRRPRNPNYKKPETDGDSNNTHEASSVSNDEPRPAGPRSYDNDFSERAERTERPEPQANNAGHQDSEARKPATTAEPAPAPKPVEAAPKPIEVIRQETE